MYVHAPSRKGAVLGTVIVLALLLVTPVCGTGFLKGQPHLTPRKLSLPPSKVVGVGLNCHGEKLPLDQIRAIGVQWVRLDLPGKDYTTARLRPLVDYYRDFGQLWILPQSVSDPAEAARAMTAAGITEIEVFNEPKLSNISPRSYAASFQAVRTAVGGKARLYGPAIGTWAMEKEYLDQCIDQGIKPDVLSFHGYHQGTPEHLSSWVAEAKRYGLPVVISELGYPTYLGQMPYRVRMSDQAMGSLFVRTRDALKGTAWCWYDGPNPPGQGESGLFDWDPKVGYKANQNYRDVAAAVARAGR